MPPVILLHSGIEFDLMAPKPEMVDIADIAHALAHICRFTGHTSAFYSVAQHSVMASYRVPREHALAALMHDAAEAYIGDVAAPLKALLPDYRAIERRVELAVALKFDLPLEMPPEVKHADLVMLATEKRDFMPATAEHWPVELTHKADERWIIPWEPKVARAEFLCRFRELTA